MADNLLLEVILVLEAINLVFRPGRSLRLGDGCCVEAGRSALELMAG